MPAISTITNASDIMDRVHLYSSGIDTHDMQSRPSKASLNSLTNSSKLLSVCMFPGLQQN